jgi:C4-dicarboxylate-binding protein DctP
VQKFVTLSDHGYIGYAVIVNKKFWEGLPRDLRGPLETAMKEASKFANDAAKKDNDESLEAVRKSGKSQIIALSAAEKAAWKKALMPVHKEMTSRIGAETMQEIYQATGFAQ